jgi:hypothetical protein
MDQPNPTTTELAARPTGEGLYKFIEGYCGFPNAAWDHPTEPDWCTGAKEREAWNAMAAILNGRLESLTADRNHWKAESERLAAEVEQLHRTNLIREARASCSLDGDTQSEGNSYVLISEDRLKRYESELAELREKVRRLEEGALNKDQEPNGDES